MSMSKVTLENCEFSLTAVTETAIRYRRRFLPNTLLPP
jgi:hypothetical protein